MKLNKRKTTMTSQGQERSFMTSRTPGYLGKPREGRRFPTNYCGLIRRDPPEVPPSLIKRVTLNEENATKKKDNPGIGKVKIMLRVSRDQSVPLTREFLRVEGNRKHVSVFVPDEQANAKSVLAPKVYAFDSVFTEETPQSEMCLSSLVEVIQAVLQGADGTVFCYGQANLGKTYVLFGADRSSNDIGLLPCAISWLYRCLHEMQKHRDVRISIKVSAIEVHGRSGKLRDLLSGYYEDPPESPLCVHEDPLLGTQLQNLSEIPSGSAERAAYLLDAALASRSCAGSRNKPEARKHSHMIFTLHLYHHSQDKFGEESKSRLHFIDLGSCEKTLIKTPNSLALSLSSLGHVIMAIVNNSKHVPFRESKLTCVLRESLGNVNCRVIMLAHVSRDVNHYSDTLSTIQMASRLHRVWKRKNKSSANANGNSSKLSGTSRLRSNHLRHRGRDDDNIGSSSGVDCTSGSELSCDTVVYVTKKGVPMSDRELTDNEGPPDAVPINIPPAISENSPPEEMVYNIAQARIHKLADKDEDFCGPDLEANEGDSTSTQLTANMKVQLITPSNGMNSDIKLPRQGARRIPVRANGRPNYNALSQTSKVLAKSTNLSNNTNISFQNKQATGCHIPVNIRRKPPRLNATGKTKLPVNSTIASDKPSKPPRKSRETQSETRPQNRSTTRSKTVLTDGTLQRQVKSGNSARPTPSSRQASLKKSIASEQSQENQSGEVPRVPTRTTSFCKPPNDANTTVIDRTAETTGGVATYRSLDVGDDHHPYLASTLNSESTSFTNHCYDDVLIPNLQEFAEKLKGYVNTRKVGHYENITIKAERPVPPYARPEPLGCAFEVEKVKTDEKILSISSKFDQFIVSDPKLRPDSLFVNLDEGDWVSDDGGEEHDDDAVNVNFYCLAFTTRNPLIPLSKRKFSQQIEKSKKRRSSLIEVNYNNGGVRKKSLDIDNERTSGINQKMLNGCKQDEELNSHSMVESTSICSLNYDDAYIMKEDNAQWAWMSSKIPQDEDAPDDGSDIEFDPSDLKEMPRLRCAYASESDRDDMADYEQSFHGEINHDDRLMTSSIIDENQAFNDRFTDREVCLYDSNSLEMSYVSTKPSLSSSVSSPSRSSGCSQSPNKRLKKKKDEKVRIQTSRSIVMTKSTSTEGARLTLVRKTKSGAPTLELLITKEDEDTSAVTSTCNENKSMRNCTEDETTRSLKQKAFTNHVKNYKSTCENNQKKSKWGGLKRFGGKKAENKLVKPNNNNDSTNITKSSSKLLPTSKQSSVKNLRNSTCITKLDQGNLKTKQKLTNGRPESSTGDTALEASIKSEKSRSTCNATSTKKTEGISKGKEPIRNITRFGFPKKSKVK